MRKIGEQCPGKGRPRGRAEKWAPPKLVAPDRRVTWVGGGEAVQPAAAFAGESLREAQLASTIGCGLLPHDYGADGQGSERRTRRMGNSAPARDAAGLLKDLCCAGCSGTELIAMLRVL